MRDTLADVLRALFVTEGRLVSVRAIMGLIAVITVAWITIDGKLEPAAIVAIAMAAVDRYFESRKGQ